jgi:flagellar protein FliO/FliZ
VFRGNPFSQRLHFVAEARIPSTAAAVAVVASMGAVSRAAAADLVAKGGLSNGVPLAQPGSAESLTQVTGALVLVVVAIFLVAWVLRRLSRLPAAGTASMRVLGGLAVGTKERILLVEAGQTQLLVGVTPGQLRTLHVFDKPVVVHDTAAGAAPSFAQRLGKALQGG